MGLFFMSLHTNATSPVRDFHFVHSLFFSPLVLSWACGTLRLWVCASQSLIVPILCVSMSRWAGSSVFLKAFCAQVNTRVHISVHNYSDSQGNCPQSSTTKRILILSGLTVPWSKGGAWKGIGWWWWWREGRGVWLHQITTVATGVTPLAFW